MDRKRKSAGPSSPSTVYFPKKKQDMSKYKRLLDLLPDTEIEPEFQHSIIAGFPSAQNHPEDLLLATRAVLRYNRQAQYDGAVALTLHFIGFFHKSGYGYAPYSCVHLFEIASIRVKSQYKVLVLCKMGDNPRAKDAIVNCRIISKEAVKLGQILYRNYMLSVVAFDPDYTCDFRTELKEQFPPFYPGLSPSQGYQFTYYAFTTNLGRRYYHEVARYYHEHIRNHDGVFDFGMLPYELREGQDASLKDLMPVIHAMMFVPIMDPNRSNEKFPYVRGILVHNKPFPWIGKGVGRIVWKSRILRFLHLSRVELRGDGQLKAIGDGLRSNPTIPCVYYNFENNTAVGNDAESFLVALKDVTAKIFFLSVAQLKMGNVKHLANALGSNEALNRIKYLYFNGNGLPFKHAGPLISYLEMRGADVENNPIVRLGVGGDDETIRAVFSCLERYPQPIEELSVAGTLMGEVGAQALIRYVKQTRTMRVLDLSDSGMDPEYIHWVLRAMNENEVVGPLRVRLNELRLNVNRRLMSIAKGFLRSNLDRWESIEFRNNGFGIFDLQFIISFLWRMNNLEEIDLSENFSADMDDIGKELAELLLIKRLKRIRLAGAPGRSIALGTEGCIFLDHLLKSGRTFEELDMSGNRMGDLGYEKMRDLLMKCDEMRELIVDGNYPSNPSIIARMIAAVKLRPNLTFFVFPYYDATNCLKGLSGEQANSHRYSMTSLRILCNRLLNDRRHALGMPSMLPFHAVPELGQLVDEISGDGGSMEQCLSGIETGIHGGITKDIRVTLPYLSEGQDIAEGGTIKEINGPKQPEYHSQFINIRINEDTYEIPDISLDLPESVKKAAEDLYKPKKKKVKKVKKGHKSHHGKKGDDRKSKHAEDDESPKRRSKKHKKERESDYDYDESSSESEEPAKESKQKKRRLSSPVERKSAKNSRKDLLDSESEERLPKTSRVPGRSGSPKTGSRRNRASTLNPKNIDREGIAKPEPKSRDRVPESESESSEEVPRKKGRKQDSVQSESSETPDEAPLKNSRIGSQKKPAEPKPMTRSQKKTAEPSDSSEEAPTKSRNRSPSRSRKKAPSTDSSEEEPAKPQRQSRTQKRDSDSSEEQPQEKRRARSPSTAKKSKTQASSDDEPPKPSKPPRPPKSPKRNESSDESYSGNDIADVPPSSAQFSDSDSDAFAKFKPDDSKRSKHQRPPPPLKRK